MESRLAVSFGKVANRERRHQAKSRPGTRAFLGLLTVLGQLALGSDPIRALGLGRSARGSEPGPMEVILHQGGKVFVGEMVGISTDGLLMLDCSNTYFSGIIPCFQVAYLMRFF